MQRLLQLGIGRQALGYASSESSAALLAPAMARWMCAASSKGQAKDTGAQQGSTTSPDAADAQAASQPSTSAAPPRKEYYSATPHIMDANSKEPLKSSQYASSFDDKHGIQKNWFTSLYKQLNYFAKTGTVPELKGRQKEVFESVEREFEGLYDRYIKAPGLAEGEHRAMLMVCLSIATHRILSNEVPDAKIVRDVIRTNQGSVMMALLMPLHRFRIWILRYLLAEEPYKLAVQFLPALQADMGALCSSEIHFGPLAATPSEASAAAAPAAAAAVAASSSGSSSSKVQLPHPLPDETSLVIRRCKYHEVLTKEDAPFLLSEFCCNHGLLWLQEFSKHGVDVSLERSMLWEDECCSIRLARRQNAP